VIVVCLCYRSVYKSIKSCEFVYSWNNESENKLCLTFNIQIGVVSTSVYNYIAKCFCNRVYCVGG
jgi:hypothetical protein